jgi:hypothetical protein
MNSYSIGTFRPVPLALEEFGKVSLLNPKDLKYVFISLKTDRSKEITSSWFHS